MSALGLIRHAEQVRFELINLLGRIDRTVLSAGTDLFQRGGAASRTCQFGRKMTLSFAIEVRQFSFLGIAPDAALTTVSSRRGQLVSTLPNADQEFTVQEVVAASQTNLLRKPFTSSHVSQMLSTLAEVGLVYKNRHGKYSLAVPLLGQFIQRQTSSDLLLKALE